MDEYTSKGERFLKWGAYSFAAILAAAFAVMAVTRAVAHRREQQAMRDDTVWGDYLRMAQEPAPMPSSVTPAEDDLPDVGDEDALGAYLRGNLLYAGKRYDAAAAQYRQVLDVDPDDRYEMQKLFGEDALYSTLDEVVEAYQQDTRTQAG